MKNFGNIFIFAGLGLIIFGILFKLAGKVKGLGKLPGDILIRKENFTFYFPLATSFIASLLLSLILYLVIKFLRRNG